MESVLNFDQDLFLRIHRGLTNNFFDWIMPIMRNPYTWAPLYLIIIIFCILQYKKKGLFIIAMLLITVGLADLFSAKLIKPLVQRVRPCNDIELSSLIIHRVPCGSGFSFPSAHAANHFAIAMFLIMVFYKRWHGVLPLGLIWAAIISFAQVYVGVHYPIDITVGALLGCMLGYITGTFYKVYQPEL